MNNTKQTDIKLRSDAHSVLFDELTENQLEFLVKDNLFKNNIIDAIIEFHKSKLNEVKIISEKILTLHETHTEEQFKIIKSLNDMLSESNNKLEIALQENNILKNK